MEEPKLTRRNIFKQARFWVPILFIIGAILFGFGTGEWSAAFTMIVVVLVIVYLFKLWHSDTETD